MRKEIRTLFGQKIGVCISVYYTLMNIFSWFFGAFPVCLTEEKSTNYSVHSVTQNFDWSVCSTSSKKLFFVLCKYTKANASCCILLFTGEKSHLLPTTKIISRQINAKDFLMTGSFYGKYQKIFGTILLSHIFQDFFSNHKN